MINKSKTTKTMDDSNFFPKVQVTYMTRVDDATQAYAYGTHGSPPVGSICLMVSIEGDDAEKIVIPISSKYRPKALKEGEFVNGNFLVGSTIKFDEEGNVIATVVKDLIATVGGDVNIAVEGKCDAVVKGNTTLTTPLLTINGNVLLNGSFTYGTIVGGGTPEVDGTFDLKSSSVMNAKGTINQSATVNNSGTINNTGSITGSGAITEGTINLKLHRTSQVQTGTGTSGVPVV